MRPDLLPRSRAVVATRRALQLSLVTLTVIFAFNTMAAAQGFGFFRSEGRISRQHPPRIYLPAVPVIANAVSPLADAQSILPRLEDRLESALKPSQRQAFTAASTVHELFVTCTVTRIKATSNTEQRTRYEWQKTGEHTVTDPATNTTTTVEDYGNVAVQYWLTTSDGELRATIEIKDSDTGLLFDKIEESGYYHNESETQTPVPTAVIHDYLAADLVNQLGQRYRTEGDSVHVLLPKGKLKDASRQLEAGRWDMALELLRNVAEFSNPHDEAFRRYGFGLAYEGLAYAQTDAGAMASLLQRAVQAYDEAAQRKRDEGTFVEARLRARGGLAELTEFLSSVTAFEATRKRALLAQGKASAGDHTASTATPPAQAVGTAAPGSSRAPLYKGIGKLTNKVIVEWMKAGITEDEIVTNVLQSRSNDFDMSPRALARLQQAGVSDRVLLAMQHQNVMRQPGRVGPFIVNTALFILQTLPWILR
jgi:hypothetical protein